jgi:hypothetical protein
VALLWRAFDKTVRRKPPVVAADAVHEDIAWPSRDEGAAQIKKFMREMIEIEPDFEWHLTTIVDGGSAVAAEWT